MQSEKPRLLLSFAIAHWRQADPLLMTLQLLFRRLQPRRINPHTIIRRIQTGQVL
jgi:hypothetical protein